MNVGDDADSLLRQFVKSDDAEAERLLSILVNERAAAIISKIVGYKTRGETSEAEDICGDVMLQLVGRFQRLRESKNEPPIENFNSYVAAVTYNACDRFVSRKRPNRRRLKNGLRYLLTHRAGFNCWQDTRGNWVCGFARWQFGNANSTAESELESNLKIGRLRDDARIFAEKAKVPSTWNDRRHAYELLTAIFDWTNAPVEIDLLTNVAAEWWNVTDEIVEIDNDFGKQTGYKNVSIQLADSRPDASIEIERRVRLQKLWNEISDLPVHQRAAVLLNLRDENGRGTIDLWLVVGVTTVEKIAAALEMTTESFAVMWNSLPLDDNQIAERLDLTRQQVINLRKSARERLARRMKGF